MPLNLADKNKIYIIQRIVGNKDMVHRLQSLGFVVGSKISVLSEINGNYVVVIKDIKILLIMMTQCLKLLLNIRQ